MFLYITFTGVGFSISGACLSSIYLEGACLCREQCHNVLAYRVIPWIPRKDSTTVLHSPCREVLFMRQIIRLCDELTLYVTSELLLDRFIDKNASLDSAVCAI